MITCQIGSSPATRSSRNSANQQAAAYTRLTPHKTFPSRANARDDLGAAPLPLRQPPARSITRGHYTRESAFDVSLARVICPTTANRLPFADFNSLAAAFEGAEAARR
jgi:hypothetical protein